MLVIRTGGRERRAGALDAEVAACGPGRGLDLPGSGVQEVDRFT